MKTGSVVNHRQLPTPLPKKGVSAKLYSQLKPKESKSSVFRLDTALAAVEYTALTVGTLATLWLSPKWTLLGGALGAAVFEATKKNKDQLDDIRLFAALATVLSAYVHLGLYSDLSIPLHVCSLSLGFGSAIALSQLVSPAPISANKTIPHSARNLEFGPRQSPGVCRS